MRSSLNCDCMCLRVHKSHMELLTVIWHWFWEGLDVPVIALITDFHPPPLLMPLTGRLQQLLPNQSVESHTCAGMWFCTFVYHLHSPCTYQRRRFSLLKNDLTAPQECNSEWTQTSMRSCLLERKRQCGCLVLLAVAETTRLHCNRNWKVLLWKLKERCNNSPTFKYVMKYMSCSFPLLYEAFWCLSAPLFRFYTSSLSQFKSYPHRDQKQAKSA